MKHAVGRRASISVRLVWPYLRLADAKGIGMAPESIPPWIVDPDARIDHGVAVELMEASIRQEADPARGLKAAALVEPEDREPLEHAARGCSNLGEAYRGLCRWFPVLNSACQLTLNTGAGHTELRYQVVRGSAEPPAFADSVISWLARFTCRYTEVTESELAFRFTQPRPAYAEEYAHYFSGTVGFAAQHNALVVPSHYLDSPLPFQSPTLTRAYQLRAERLLSELASLDMRSWRPPEHD